MAASKKKRVEQEMGADENEDDMEYDSNDDGESDEEDDEEMQEEVQLDFEARIPEDCDLNGMRTLLQQVFLKANIDLTEITNTLISQNYVGSVIKQPYNADDDDDDDDDDEDTVLALVSVLNLTERKDLNCVKQLKSLLLERCQKCGKDKKDKLQKILSDPDHHVGYLISERYLNLPPTLTVPMFDSLIKEMEKAKQKNMKYSFDYFLMVCKTFEMKMAHNKKETFFSNSEEELFQNVSELSFTYSVANERDGVVEKWSSSEDMEPFRTVLVFPAEKFPAILDKIKQELSKT